MTEAKRPKTGGRKAGTPNKLTKTVKMMILSALDKAGGERYLLKQAKENPTAFMTLLGKVMPTQVVGDVSHRYVARVPAPSSSTEAWQKTYAPPTAPARPAKPH